MAIKWPNALGLALIGGYLILAAAQPLSWHVIDGANLIFHEGGHTLFMWGPHWLYIAGGSIFQVLLPLGLALYFAFKRQPYAAALLLFWVGQSAVNVSVYAGDAMRMRLPLIADGVLHDWNELLLHFGLLRRTDLIAGIIRASGWAFIATGALAGFWFSLGSSEPKTSGVTAKVPSENK
jgi:hypothetical protein